MSANAYHVYRLIGKPGIGKQQPARLAMFLFLKMLFSKQYILIFCVSKQ
jgi:hypothetical protein